MACRFLVAGKITLLDTYYTEFTDHSFPLGFVLVAAILYGVLLVRFWQAKELGTVYSNKNSTDVHNWIAKEASHYHVTDETIEERLRSGQEFEIVHELVQRAEWSRSLTILLIGESGVGKATLVNGIIGEELIVRNQSSVQLISKREINGIDVTVIDTAEILDAEEDEIEEIKNEAAKGVDLVLFCIQMTQVRFRRNDIELIWKVREVFPVEIWNNAIFILTYANQLRRAGEPYENHFMEKLSQWKDVLLNAVEEHGKAAQEVAQKIPVIPAGYYKDSNLPYCDEWTNRNKCENWFGKLWYMVLERVQCGKKIALLEINRNRFKISTGDINQRRPLYEMAISPTSDLMESDFVITIYVVVKVACGIAIVGFILRHIILYINSKRGGNGALKQGDNRDQEDSQEATLPNAGENREQNDSQEATPPNAGDKGEQEHDDSQEATPPNAGDKGEQEHDDSQEATPPNAGDKGEQEHDDSQEATPPNAGDKGEQEHDDSQEATPPNAGDKGEQEHDDSQEATPPNAGDKGEQEHDDSQEATPPNAGDKGEQEHDDSQEATPPNAGDKGEQEHDDSQEATPPNAGDKGEQEHDDSQEATPPNAGDKGEQEHDDSQEATPPNAGDKGEQEHDDSQEATPPNAGDKGEQEHDDSQEATPPNAGDKGEQEHDDSQEATPPNAGDKGEQEHDDSQEATPPNAGDKGEQEHDDSQEATPPNAGDKGEQEHDDSQEATPPNAGDKGEQEHDDSQEATPPNAGDKGEQEHDDSQEATPPNAGDKGEQEHDDSQEATPPNAGDKGEQEQKIKPRANAK